MPMASTHMAADIGERIRNAVEEQKFSVRTGTSVQLGLSIGVACFPEEGETTEELLTAAARKMQNNKHLRKTVITLANSPISSLDAFR
jgi:diguanylate cyclase (GGDEF)-like protein